MPANLLSRRIAVFGIAGASLAKALLALGSREPAPRFSAKTLEGEKFNNETLKGKVVLLQFWATWCPHCKNDQEAVDLVAREFADQGLVVLGVDVGEGKKKVRDYLARTPRECKIVLNEDTNLPAVFAAKTFPTYVVIDRESKIVDRRSGEIHEDGLRRLLAKAGVRHEGDVQ